MIRLCGVCSSWSPSRTLSVRIKSELITVPTNATSHIILIHWTELGFVEAIMANEEDITLFTGLFMVNIPKILRR